jgi:2-alkenal reductase
MLQKIKQTGLVAVLTLALGLGIGVSVAGPMATVQGQNAARSVQAQNVVDNEADLLRGIYNKANPSVVSIDVRMPQQANSSFGLPGQGQRQRQGQQPQAYAYAAGSGFVYDTTGHIVTNAHVVEGADRVEVTFSDGAQMYAKVVGIDADSDLAVIQVEGNASRYQPLALANSDQLQVGDRAIAIGNPFQRSGTMTQGIVSGLHRSVDGVATSADGQAYQIPDAVQTDAALNPGNSGGPLLNDQGQVIGVNEQIESQVRQSSGVSFAIPSNLVKLVADTLIQSGKIEHSWLGIGGTSLTLDINDTLKVSGDTRGAYVTSVQSGSPADKAGLKGAASNGNVNSAETPTGGDIITAIDKQPVKAFDDLTSYLFTKTKPGQNVALTILRDGRQQDIQVQLGTRPHANGTTDQNQ